MSSAPLNDTDDERQANATFADPDGRALADRLASAILAWSARSCNRLGWARQTSTGLVSPERHISLFSLSAPPLDTSQPVTVRTYNAATDSDDPYTGSVRKNAAGVVKTGDRLGYGHEAVEISYTGGYDTLPDDLRQALSELLVQRLNDATNGGTVVTQVKALGYSETYSLSEADIPGDAMEVLASVTRTGTLDTPSNLAAHAQPDRATTTALLGVKGCSGIVSPVAESMFAVVRCRRASRL
jgi:hypothetical protein